MTKLFLNIIGTNSGTRIPIMSLEHLWLLIRKLKTRMKPISSTSTQDFDREKVEREFINLASHYQQIGESFKKLVRRSCTYEEVTTSNQFSKKCLFYP